MDSLKYCVMQYKGYLYVIFENITDVIERWKI